MSAPKHLSRRDFLRISSFSVAGLALAACAVPAAAPSAPAAGDSAAAPSGEKITIRHHARIGQQEDTLYDMQAPKFEAENPNIDIVKESFPGADYPAKMSTMFAGGTMGDVIWSALGGAAIQFAYSQGQVASVNDLVQSENIDLSQWYEGSRKGITVDGNLLGLPFKSHPGLAVVYYNKTAIEKEGLTVPDSKWTQDDHMALAKALTKREGDRTTQFGFLPGALNWWKTFVTLTRSFGGQLVSEDGSKFLIAEDAGLQALQKIVDIFHIEKVGPLPSEIVGDPTADMWVGGQLATYQGGTSVSVTAGAIGDSFEWMVVPNAIGPGGVGGSDYEVDAQCVTSTTAHPTEAFKWVQYLCSKDSGIQLGLIGGTVGGRPDVYGAEELLKFPFRVVFKEIMDNAQDSRITANWRQTEAEAAFTQLMAPIWDGTEKPTDAYVETMRSQIQDIMDKPKP